MQHDTIGHYTSPFFQRILFFENCKRLNGGKSVITVKYSTLVKHFGHTLANNNPRLFPTLWPTKICVQEQDTLKRLEYMVSLYSQVLPFA